MQAHMARWQGGVQGQARVCEGVRGPKLPTSLLSYALVFAFTVVDVFLDSQLVEMGLRVGAELPF